MFSKKATKIWKTEQKKQAKKQMKNQAKNSETFSFQTSQLQVLAENWAVDWFSYNFKFKFKMWNP